ncbi:unnamed protein product [Sphenostylis stenocarpa]|uniref:Uncharacterized protein n=1 Tax=Sphenostylis stenocarpa TaxID=92480 RepID=A0AA86T607_9FABA|nr:unnamed protein product [Sphenostylis stenocarpa]
MLLWQSYEDEETVIGDTLYILVDDDRLGRKCMVAFCTVTEDKMGPSSVHGRRYHAAV